jgi:SAM-dependent methyltransferase
MEVRSSEAEKLKSLVQGWWEQSNYELEATFGDGSVVNQTDFLAIATRLRQRGFTSVTQEDRLSILLPEHVRFTLTGNGEIMQYCKDDNIATKEYTVIIKDRTATESHLDFEEYGCRVKMRRELEMAPDDVRARELIERWQVQKKAFRLIRRWSFAGKGVRFDLSIVRSTEKTAAGQFKWVKSFREQNLFKQPPTYEVEVELLRDEGVTPAKALGILVAGMGEVLRGLQKNPLLITRTQVKNILNRYKELTGSDRFRGVSPVTLELDNMLADGDEGVPNIRNGYNVTDKADGLRVLGFCDGAGELFMIDQAMNIYKTGLASPACANSLVDAEWVTRDEENRPISHLLLFDIYYAPGGDKVDTLPFAAVAEGQDGRYRRLQDWEKEWNSAAQKATMAQVTDANKMKVAVKKFIIARAGDLSIFAAAETMLDIPQIYHTDGLIFTPNAAPLPQKAGDTFFSQFKWKPAEENSIDFLVNFEKDAEAVMQDKVTVTIKPETNETVRYKTLNLYVKSSGDVAYEDPRTTILFEQPLPRLQGKGPGQAPRKRDIPILFNPVDYPDTMASICYREVFLDDETGDEYVKTDGTDEIIRDRSIVEMKYVHSNPPGWRWVPLRVRHDKTERLMRGKMERTMNGKKTAFSVWNSINNPITLSMIRKGTETPSEEEISRLAESMAVTQDVGKKYYERKAPKEDMMIVTGLRQFHNRYVKENILYKVALAGGGKKVLDVACGKAGDLQKWRRGKASFVLGVDTAGENIRDPASGAYRRYMDTMVSARRDETLPRMVFAIGDSSQPLMDGTAGATPQESDILRSVFGRAQPEGPIPTFIQRHAAGELRTGVDAVVCMFALHYFFKDMGTLDGLVRNIADTLAVGGHFIGCCFDGDAVFRMLRGLPRGAARVGKEGETPIWSIKKLYDVEELLMDETSVGLGIDVEFVSIGTTHTEYLVPFELLKSKLADIGMVLLPDAEVKRYGLQGVSGGTDMFEATYALTDKKFPMSESVKEFSFLNRWFIFKRVAAGVAVAEEAAEATASVQGIALAEDIRADVSVGESATVADAVVAEAMQSIREAKEELGAVEVAPRTIPTTAAPAARRFEASEVLLVYGEAKVADVLGIKDPGALRWMAPSAPFPILARAEDGTEVKYPTVEHYMAAMKYEKATNKPELARTLFAQDGSIHQDFEGKRLIETQAGKRPLTEERDAALLKEEVARVKSEVTPQKMKLYRATYTESAWMAVKDDLLRGALKQRMDRDARFKRAVEAARNKGKYILYYTGPSGASELGGVRKTQTGMIEGENKVGRFIMALANFPAF